MNLCRGGGYSFCNDVCDDDGVMKGVVRCDDVTEVPDGGCGCNERNARIFIRMSSRRMGPISMTSLTGDGNGPATSGPL